jgi:hypothetical protein
MSEFGKGLEKSIKAKLGAISRGSMTVKDAGVNVMLKRLKSIDEASYLDLQSKYIETVKGLSKK